MRIGILGFGFMGLTHLQAYRKLPGVTVAAICSENKAVLAGDLSNIGGNRTAATELPDISEVNRHASVDALLTDPSLDIIDICLPTDLHASNAVAALASGKHVLCEKPMALATAGCSDMLGAAALHNRILMIGHVLRFWPEYLMLQRFASDPTHGRIRHATFIRQCARPDWSRWLTDDARSGGALFDLLIHDIDQALALFGLPERVNCKRFAGPDTAMATLLYRNGPEVRIQGGWFAPGTPLSMSFQVRTDHAELDFSAAGLFLSDHTGQRRALDVPVADAYESEIAYFVDCCRANRQPADCPPAASADAVAVALLLKQSCDLGGQPLECKVLTI